MSKVICDVCGTAYAETVQQCPICGCVQSADAKIATSAVEENTNGNGSYTYVKGGRFSKANVKKRNKTGNVETASRSADSRQDKNEKNKRENNDENNKGLVITVIALLLAIIAVVVYIVVRFFAPFSANQNVVAPETNPSIETQGPETLDVPCTEITLGSDSITLNEVGAAALLDVVLTPEDTTEIATFESDDETVATVDHNGKITAVAAGETVIRVSCGSITAECTVICEIESVEEPSDPSEPEVTEPVVTEPVLPDVEYKFNTVFLNEMTLPVGTTFGLRLQDPNKKSVEATFSSANALVCTVDEEGTVRAVAKGSTTIKAEFNGKTYECKVIVN